MRLVLSTVCMLLVTASYGNAQTPGTAGLAQSSPPSNAVATLNASQSAFSAGKPVTSVEMTGIAHWSSGAHTDSGPAKLSASVTGENRAEFSLSNGPRVEAQSAIGVDRTCTWSGKDGISHGVAMSNCWTATIWFLPHLALQGAGLPSGLEVENAGTTPGDTAPHIQHHFIVPSGSTSATFAKQIDVWSRTDITLDSTTYLPNSLKYSIHPDNNSSVDLKVEVRYSNYQNISGLELPMHIERYVNGSLQVSIDINSATVN